MTSSAWALGAIIAGITAVAAAIVCRRGPGVRTPAVGASRPHSQPPPGLGSPVEQHHANAPTPRRPPAPDGTFPDHPIEQEAVELFLAGIRDAIPADDVLLWSYSAGGTLTHMAASSGGGTRTLAITPPADSLLRWAVEQGMTASNSDTDPSLFVAAPVSRGDQVYGAVALLATDREVVSRDRAKGLLPRYAARLALLLELLRDGRGAHRYRGRAVLLARAAERVQGSRDVEALAVAVCETAMEISGGTRAAFVIWREDAGVGQVWGTSPGHPIPPGLQVAAESFVGTACRERQRFTAASFTNGSALPIFGPGEPERLIASFAIAPLHRDHTSLGAIVVEGEAESQISTEEGSLLQLLASLTSQALQNVRRLEEVTTASITDALTQLPNRRQFDDRLRQHLAECDRTGDVLSLIVADIDHFKRINDSYGHEAGDAVLVAVARVVSRSLRVGDLCARYGGEELGILLPGTSLELACEVAERLRRTVEELRVRVGGTAIGVTVSLGVASYPTRSRNPEQLFAAADRALYTAKEAGRNQVKCSMPT